MNAARCTRCGRVGCGCKQPPTPPASRVFSDFPLIADPSMPQDLIALAGSREAVVLDTKTGKHEITPVCRCGCITYQHEDRTGKCHGRHNQCACTEFRPLP